MNQSIRMKILNLIKEILTMHSLNRYLSRIVGRIVFKVNMFLYNRDEILFWDDRDWIAKSEREFVESSDDKRDKAHHSFLKSLVLSYLPDDVHCGVTILQDLLLRARTPRQKRKVMYLLAIGHYRIGNLSKSIEYVSRSLEIKPLYFRVMVVRDLVKSRIFEERRRNFLLVPAMAIGLVTGLLGSTTLLFDPTWVMEALRLELLAKKGVSKVVTGSLPDISSPMEMHEEMYLLAHRYLTRGHFEDMPRCNYLIDRCLEIAPDWKPAMTLKRRMKYAYIKAYIGDIVYEGTLWAIGGIGSISILRWAGF